MKGFEMAQFQQEEMLRYRGIADEADAIADMAIQLSIYYKEIDIDKILDMPASRLQLLVKQIEQHNKLMKEKMKQ